MHIGSNTNYPTYKQIELFLETRIRISVAIKCSKAGASSQEKCKAQSVSFIRRKNLYLNATISTLCLWTVVGKLLQIITVITIVSRLDIDFIIWLVNSSVTSEVGDIIPCCIPMYKIQI